MPNVNREIIKIHKGTPEERNKKNLDAGKEPLKCGWCETEFEGVKGLKTACPKCNKTLMKPKEADKFHSNLKKFGVKE